MDQQRLHEWQGIEQLTDAIIALASNLEWERMLEQYQLRDQQLEAFFSIPLAESDSPFMRQAIERLLEKDEELRQLCLAAREEAVGELGKVNLGRKVEAAYNQNR